MICPNCKSNIPDDTILCPNCSYNVTDYDKDESFLESVNSFMNKRREHGGSSNQLARTASSKVIALLAFAFIQSMMILPIAFIICMQFLFSNSGTKYKLIGYESRNGGYVGVYVSEKNSNSKLQVDDVYQTKEEVPLEYNYNLKKNTTMVSIIVFLGIILLIEILVIRAFIKAFKKYKKEKITI